MLDEKFRGRIADIAGQGDEGLDDAARERIVKTVKSRGPGLVSRSRAVRRATLVAGPLLAVAAAVAVWLSGASTPSTTSAVASSDRGGAGLACEGWDVSEAARVGFVPNGDVAKLDLGTVALIVAATGAQATVREASACRTEIALDKGRVVVHAKDLGGGELSVTSGDTTVTVKGTLFSVTRVDDSVAVEVSEGLVAVKRGDEEHSVPAGHRLMLSKLGSAHGELSTVAKSALEASVGQQPAVGLDSLRVAPKEGAAATSANAPRTLAAEPGDEGTVIAGDEPPVAILKRAEALRRAGDHEGARKLYRRVGGTGGVVAEAAWLALARMELKIGNAEGARDAVTRRREGFGRGTLGAEALWIEVRTYRATGDEARARRIAEELMRSYPDSAQAGAARMSITGEVPQ